MRIVAGDLKGRPLAAPRGWKVRPTSDRVREAIFSALGEVAGARVLDLYCGTGALAIEALSRGAASATLVDRDTRAALGNVRRLGLEDRTELVGADVSRYLSSLVSRISSDERRATSDETRRAMEAERFELIFLDPPYKLADRLGPELDMPLASLLSPEGRVIAESPVGRPLVLESLEPLRERRYGSTQVTFYGPPAERA